jgi:endonuclease YncB( thermonuclease family)
MVEFGGIQKDNWVLKNRFMHLANDDIDDDHIDAGSQVVVVGSTVEKNPYYQEINMVGQKVGAVGSKVEKNPYYQEINETKEEFIDVCPVEVDRGYGAPHQRTRTSCMMFNVAQVSKPLAAAGKVVDAGNRVVLDQRGSYVEHVATGERMHLRKEKGVYVFDVEFEDGDRSTITLDSGAGVNVWPRGLKTNIPMEAKNESLKMFAANGTPIEHDGTKRVRFKGIQAPFHGQSR